jgi:hypothetical protein
MALNDELAFFQNLLLDVLVRRAVFRKFENELKGRKIAPENDMMWLVWYGYVISQLSDCRKFFDRNGSVHSFPFVVKHLKEKSLRDRHATLFDKWKNEKLEAVINKHMLHADQAASTIKTEVHIVTLDSFIDDLEKYLGEIVGDLNKYYQGIGSMNYIAFLGDREREVDAFFKIVRKNPQGAD